MAQQKKEKNVKQKLNNPVELGLLIDWNYASDLESVIQKSKEEKKPILILFQEIPGCSGCQQYGKNVLSSKVIYEIITNNFIPIAIYNNRGGKDKEILDRFKEQSWNYPVLRIVDDSLKDIVHKLEWHKCKTADGVQKYLQNSSK